MPIDYFGILAALKMFASRYVVYFYSGSVMS